MNWIDWRIDELVTVQAVQGSRVSGGPDRPASPVQSRGIKKAAPRGGVAFFSPVRGGWSGLLHHLNSAGGAVGVGGNNDGYTVSLLHLLTSHVEVANVSNSLAVHQLVNASTGISGLSGNGYVHDNLAISLAFDVRNDLNLDGLLFLSTVNNEGIAYSYPILFFLIPYKDGNLSLGITSLHLTSDGVSVVTRSGNNLGSSGLLGSNGRVPNEGSILALVIVTLSSSGSGYIIGTVSGQLISEVFTTNQGDFLIVQSDGYILVTIVRNVEPTSLLVNLTEVDAVTGISSPSG